MMAMAVTKKAMAKMTTAEMTMTKPVMAVASEVPAVTVTSGVALR